MVARPLSSFPSQQPNRVLTTGTLNSNLPVRTQQAQLLEGFPLALGLVGGILVLLWILNLLLCICNPDEILIIVFNHVFQFSLLLLALCSGRCLRLLCCFSVLFRGRRGAIRVGP